MQQKQVYYKTLLERYLRGSLSEGEAQELFDYIAEYPEQVSILLTEDDSKAFEEKLNLEFAVPEATSARLHNRLLADIRKTSSVTNTASLTKAPVYNVGFSYRWWAAAAIIILASTGAYLWFQRAEKPQQIAERKIINDAPPGKNGAILILSDGRKVVLDSLEDGMVATQGNVEVKLKDGQLLYDEASVGNGELKNAVANTVTTPKGRQYQLKLPDGTKVWLNAASSIRYPVFFAGKERSVEITGEAYFEVAHNTAMPFTVKKVNENASIQVLGTHFNVNAYDDEAALKITLLEGSVKIVKGNAVGILKPGQQGQLNNNTASLKITDNVDMEAVMAWKNGYFFFNQTDLSTVMRQLSRWYDVEVVYEDTVPVMSFGGGITRNTNLSQVIKILEESKVHFRIEGRKIVVTQ